MLTNQLKDQQQWRLIDQSTLGLHIDALQSFATDDTLCTSVGEHGSSPVIRSWVHDQTVVLGIQDTRLPFINDAIDNLTAKGYRVVVRNSGGLAVMLDRGILNLSLVKKEEKKFSINAGYDLMFELIKSMFAPFNVTIEAREIVGSYCPGSYDLSIAGKKFAGISQRRIRGGVAVQIYLGVFGSGSARAALIQDFYQQATRQQPVKFTYPEIKPETMASLSELLHIELTVEKVMYALLKTVSHNDVTLVPSELTPLERALFDNNYKRILARNEKALDV